MGRKSLKTLFNGKFRSMVSSSKQPIENIRELKNQFSENKARLKFGVAKHPLIDSLDSLKPTSGKKLVWNFSVDR